MRLSVRGVVGAVAVGCLLSGPLLAQQQPREVPWALPSKSMVAAAARIADEMGLFAKQGIRPKFTYLDSAASATAAVLGGSAEIAQADTNAAVIATGKGQPMVIVGNHYNGFSASLVLTKAAADKLKVKADAPAAERLKALDGLLLASTSAGSNLTVAYKNATAAVGATPRFTFMALASMGAALDQGIVDGAIMTAPFWAFPVVKGNGVLWISAPKGEVPQQYAPIIGSTSVARKDFADANPEVMKKIVAAFEELSASFTQRPAETKAAIGRLYPEIDAKTLDLVFEMESKAMASKVRPSVADLATDIAAIKSAGIDIGGSDKLDPSVFLLKP